MCAGSECRATLTRPRVVPGRHGASADPFCGRRPGAVRVRELFDCQEGVVLFDGVPVFTSGQQ